MTSFAARAPNSEASNEGQGLTAPAMRLKSPALFLDMDGVLAPLAETPEAVVATPRRTAVLRRLDRALGGRLAVISGRTLAEIDRLTEGAALSASGIHGLERRRRDGSMQTMQASRAVRDAVEAFDAFAVDWPGVRVEDKGLAVGLHYRQAPEAGEAVIALARDVAAKTGLALQAGHMIVELKTPGADKGAALTAFMAEPPFAGATPIMLGDDLTDEYGFEAAAKLGGFGVLVGPMRETAARYRLETVDDVLDWLDGVAEANETAVETAT